MHLRRVLKCNVHDVVEEWRSGGVEYGLTWRRVQSEGVEAVVVAREWRTLHGAALYTHAVSLVHPPLHRAHLLRSNERLTAHTAALAWDGSPHLHLIGWRRGVRGGLLGAGGGVEEGVHRRVHHRRGLGLRSYRFSFSFS